MIKSTIDRIKIGIQTLGAKVHSSPIIVLGNQKSGTTAIAALLSEMTGASVALDLKKEIRDPVIDRMKTSDMPMRDFVTRNKLDFSREIVKEPSLTPFFDELRDYFEGARFIMVVRDPRDNIRSILNRLRIPGDLKALTEAHDRHITPAWRLIMDGRWLGIDANHYIDRLAKRWNYTTQVYLDNTDAILLCRYETFLANKVAEIERLADTLAMPKRCDIAHRVNVQFQPAGDHSVRVADFFGENLKRIESLCATGMEKMNYVPST